MYHPESRSRRRFSLGDLKHPQTPENRSRCIWSALVGKTEEGATPAGKRRALDTTFETFERNIRDQLATNARRGRLRSSARHCLITVNRAAWLRVHLQQLFDPLEWVFTNSEHRPNVIARQPYGFDRIANSDCRGQPTYGHGTVGSASRGGRRSQSPRYAEARGVKLDKGGSHFEGAGVWWREHSCLPRRDSSRR